MSETPTPPASTNAWAIRIPDFTFLYNGDHCVVTHVVVIGILHDAAFARCDIHYINYRVQKPTLLPGLLGEASRRTIEEIITDRVANRLLLLTPKDFHHHAIHPLRDPPP